MSTQDIENEMRPKMPLILHRLSDHELQAVVAHSSERAATSAVACFHKWLLQQFQNEIDRRSEPGLEPGGLVTPNLDLQSFSEFLLGSWCFTQSALSPGLAKFADEVHKYTVAHAASLLSDAHEALGGRTDE
jgi:hypothetical protein